MNLAGKIAGINVLILFIYMVFIYISNGSGSEADLGFFLLAATCIAFHVFFNFVTALYYFLKSNKAQGKAFLLSAVIVLVIGFSSCLGGASLL